MFYFALTVTKSSKDHTRILASQPASYPANIRLDEDVLKTSFVFVFTRRLQDEYVRLSLTSSEDVLVKTNILVLAVCLQDVFKTPSRRLQDVLQRYLQNVFKAYH